MVTTSAQRYERFKMYNTLTKDGAVVSLRQRRAISPFDPRLLGIVIVAAPHLFSSHATAVPFSSIHIARNSPRKRVDSNGSPDVPLQIWVPILVITVVLAATAILTCSKRSLRSRLGVFINRTATESAVPNAQGTRELTAEQLAGTINGASATAGAGGRTRRNRRPRRTPSQISTVSLPAYNKEPGEEELVIFRGPQDLEDAGMPDAVVMPSVSEDGEDSVSHSRENSQTSRYFAMPASSNNVPLLHHDHHTSADRSMQSLQPPGDGMPRGSFETLNSSEEASSLMRVNNGAPAYEPDPRGEAPAYFEAVDFDDQEISQGNTAASASHMESISSPVTPEQAPQRRSGFRSLLNALGNPNRTSISHGPSNSLSHTRAESSFSFVSSDASHGRETSRSRASHRPSPSGSGSLLSLSPFRTISRQKSFNNINMNQLTSPSLISLNSISAPLTHTAMRTEFTYPKSGPTPEQLKLISSREAFSRFGVPYGADAIAYAASASRQDLDVPPPDFDTSESETQQAPASAGPSRLRASSNAAEMQQEADASDSFSSSDSEPASHPSSPRAPTGASRPGPQVAPVSTSGTPNEDAPAPNVNVLSTHAATLNPTLGPPSSTPPETAALPVPPTSFRAPGNYDRSESRASSYSINSFATAAESLMPPTPPGNDLPNQSEPTTPRLGGQHALEPTDATITQMATPGLQHV